MWAKILLTSLPPCPRWPSATATFPAQPSAAAPTRDCRCRSSIPPPTRLSRITRFHGIALILPRQDCWLSFRCPTYRAMYRIFIASPHTPTATMISIYASTTCWERRQPLGATALETETQLAVIEEAGVAVLPATVLTFDCVTATAITYS